MKVKSLSRVRFLATPWTAAYQAPPSMGFSRLYRAGHDRSDLAAAAAVPSINSLDVESEPGPQGHVIY